MSPEFLSEVGGLRLHRGRGRRGHVLADFLREDFTFLQLEREGRYKEKLGMTQR